MATKKVTDEFTVRTENSEVTTESVYSVGELAECSTKVFGTTVRSECVVAAFKEAGKRTATLTEARAIVEKFMKKEII